MTEQTTSLQRTHTQTRNDSLAGRAAMVGDVFIYFHYGENTTRQIPMHTW